MKVKPIGSRDGRRSGSVRASVHSVRPKHRVRDMGHVRSKPEKANDPSRRRLDSLTGLRFFAVLVVFGLHIAPLFEENQLRSFSRLFLMQGRVGVSFFFILSGFVLTWSRKTGDTPYAFYRRRFARVYPNHIGTFLVVAVVLLYREESLNGLSAMMNLALVHSWFPDPVYRNGMNSVSWSLSCEAFFYALFPFLIVRLSALTVRSRRLMLFGMSVAVLLVPFIHLGSEASLASSHLQEWFVYYSPLTRLLEFVAGMILAHEVREERWPRIPFPIAAGFATLGYIAAGFFGSFNTDPPAHYSYVAITVVPFMLLITSAAQASYNGNPSWLGSARMIRLGDVSFAFYLVHGLLLQLFGSAVPQAVFRSEILSVFVAISIFLICLAVSMILHLIVERPTERWLRGV